MGAEGVERGGPEAESSSLSPDWRVTRSVCSPESQGLSTSGCDIVIHTMLHSEAVGSRWFVVSIKNSTYGGIELTWSLNLSHQVPFESIEKRKHLTYVQPSGQTYICIELRSCI